MAKAGTIIKSLKAKVISMRVFEKVSKSDLVTWMSSDSLIR
jgi:hypothetical protein